MSYKCIQYRNFGKSGLKVSNLALGTWVTFGGQVSDETAEAIVTMAFENGINCFDTAEVYNGGKAEIVLGKILRKKLWRRSSYIISSKLFWGGKAKTEKGLSRKHIIEGLMGTLNRLQLNYVDIVWANKQEPGTPIEEIVRAFTYVINQGWSFYWGTSRWNVKEIMEAFTIARQFNLIPPIAEQTEYHMFQREKVELQLPELSKKIGLGIMTWSPLACGILTGKYDDGIPCGSRASMKGYGWLKEKILSEEGQQRQLKVRQLTDIAKDNDMTTAQQSIAWCLRNEGQFTQSVILGVSSVDQLCENLQALSPECKLETFTLSQIEQILANKPVPPKRSVKSKKDEKIVAKKPFKK